MLEAGLLRHDQLTPMNSFTFFRIACALYCALLCTSVKGEKESHVIGIVGGSADLPCDVDVSSCGKVYFITWTKNVSSGEWKRLYLYSDTVEKPLQELANPDRADFFLSNHSAYLRISRLKIEDDGVYKCDVTYVQGKCPSLSFASLVMHAKPSKPEIEKDGKIAPSGSEVGPFLEGYTTSFECETSGGKPNPDVAWYKGDKLLDSESRVTPEKNGAFTVVSTVSLTFERDDAGANIECRVNNEAIDEPLVSYVKVNLHVGPSSLEISGPKNEVTEGDFVSLTCEVEGAKPAASIVWFNKSIALNESITSEEEEEDDGTFRTVSKIEFRVSRRDHQGTFYCQATNSVLQSKEKLGEGALLKSIKLEVLFAPYIVVQPSSGALVNEGETEVIHCTYEANPFDATNIKWYKDDERLRVPTQGKLEEVEKGYPALKVMEVDKDDGGYYWCSLENDIGKANASNRVHLDVLYPPIVTAVFTPQNKTEGVDVSMICNLLDGNPQSLLNVRWYKDGELKAETMNRSHSWHNVTRSISGNYSCMAENAAGWGPQSEIEELLVKYSPGPATLKVLNPPLKGQSSLLQCIVEDMGLPEASEYLWKRDSTVLATIKYNPNFTINPLMVESEGNYTCAAVNEVGTGERGFAYVDVQAPPNFIRGLPHKQGAARDSPHVSFECHVECDPLCELHWMKDDDVIDGSDMYIIRTQERKQHPSNDQSKSLYSILQFNMVAWPGRRLDRDRDRANYTCFTTATDAGPGVSSTVLFQVEYRPEHMRVTESILSVKEGHIPPPVECWASSWPESTYMWKKGNMVLAIDDTLTFNDTVDRDDGGTFVCVAENQHGKAQIEMKLNVLYKPQCKITQSRDKDGDHVLVCKADGNPSYINFTWIKNNDTLDEDDHEIEYEDSRSIYVLPADPSKSLGYYSCIAVNDIGDSEPCGINVDGPEFAGINDQYKDKSVLVLASVIGSIAIFFVFIIIIIIIIMRRRRMTGEASPAKPVLGHGDNLYQNVGGGTNASDRKQNGPAASETEGNVMYENMPFHRQGPYKPGSSDEMIYADLYDDIKAGKVPDPRLKPPLPPKGIGKKPKEPPLPPKTKSKDDLL